MKRPQAFTEAQKRRFNCLKKQLMTACSIGDVQGGMQITKDIKDLLLPTGHHIKYYEMLLIISEMLILKKEYDITDVYLTRVVNNTRISTRLFQEASFLLAICKMHKHNLEASEKHLRDSLHSTAIKDSERRKQFIKRISERFEEESLIASFGEGEMETDNERIISEVQNNFERNVSDEELLGNIGSKVPQHAIDFMKRMFEMAKRQLEFHERKMLPPPPGSENIINLGRRTFNALSRRLWVAICPPETKFQQVLDKARDPQTLVLGIVAELGSQGFGFPVAMMLAGISTFILRKTVNGYCKNFKPEPIMGERYKRTT